jgi:hypothetical protein
MAVTPQDKFVFGITPAPTAENKSLINWRAYLNEQIDSINIVDEKTNTLVGTIGGSASYKFSRLPKSYAATYNSNPDVVGDCLELGENPGSDPIIELSNGKIVRIDGISNFFNNGILIMDAREIAPIDVNSGWWVAFKISDSDPELLEKVAELHQTDAYWNNGYQFTFSEDGVENVCKYIVYESPFSDNNLLKSEITTLTITQVGSTYTLTSAFTTFNYGGATTISLYNDNAPSPVLPGVADWTYRTPYNSLNNNYDAIMNGSEPGWIWYGNADTKNTLYTYQAGYNLLTGETSFVNPISALSSTTNFNPLGVIDGDYFGNNWESHPSGVFYGVSNRQPLNSYNNTNDVTALFSPRWVNNKKVTFLNQRNPYYGDFLHRTGDFFNNQNDFISNFSWAFDSENIYVFLQYSFDDDGYTEQISRFKLDSDVKEQEIQVLPLSLVNDNYDWNYYDNEKGLVLANQDPISDYMGFPETFSYYTNIFWQKNSPKAYQLQNNTFDLNLILGNKFFSGDSNRLFYNCIKFGIQYDVFDVVS